MYGACHSEEACEDNPTLGCHRYRSEHLLLNVLPKLNPERCYNRQIPKGTTRLILFTPKPIFNVSWNRNSSSTGELHILIILFTLHKLVHVNALRIVALLLTRMLLKVLCTLLSRHKGCWEDIVPFDIPVLNFRMGPEISLKY